MRERWVWQGNEKNPMDRKMINWMSSGGRAERIGAYRAAVKLCLRHFEMDVVNDPRRPRGTSSSLLRRLIRSSSVRSPLPLTILCPHSVPLSH